ncbi:MAG TPA: twin-arginine translocase TatA/TatE family subunit [Solirubrobacteraceae bacterium]|nr:twin-arginine translocase TatA/TatE family subunit [Solirubrobacteraceae bacterium]
MGLDNPLHIAFLLVVALLVFGAKRLPEMGRSLGSGMRGFRDALSGEAQPAATLAIATDTAPVAPAAAPAHVQAQTPAQDTSAPEQHAA